MSIIATLPTSTHFSILKKALEKESHARRNLPVSRRDEAVREINQCIESLACIKAAFDKLKGDNGGSAA